MALPATITPATPLGSDLKSDGDNQLRALKQFIVDVLGIPANTPVNNPAFAITAGGLVTVPQALALSSTLTVAGATTLTGGVSGSVSFAGIVTMVSNLIVNGTVTLNSTLSVASAMTSTKLTLNPGVSGRTPNAGYDDLVIEGAASANAGISFLSPAAGLAAGLVWGDSDNDVAQLTYTHSDGLHKILSENGLYFKDASLTHGMTSSVEESTFLYLRAVTGAELRGYGSSTYGIRLQGAATTASSAASTAATGALGLDGLKKNGTTTQPLSANENIAVFQSGGLTRHVFANDGDIHLDGVSNDNAYDDYDDLKLLTAARASLMPDGDFKERFSEWIAEYAPVLAQGKIITYNDDGHHFVSYKGMQGLIIDTIRQLGERIICLEQQQPTVKRGRTIKSAWRKLLQKLNPTFALAKVRS